MASLPFSKQYVSSEIFGTEEIQRNVIGYIDDSNIFESAKRYSAWKKNFRPGVLDVTCRVNSAKLVRTVLEKRKAAFVKLYGSNPSSSDPDILKVWEAIERSGVQVKTFNRSRCTRKEKEIDSSLVADAVEDIITMQDQLGDDRTLILFSGDRDMLCVVKKALKYGYRVEVWSFSKSMNDAVYELQEENQETLSVNLIDDIFKEICFNEVEWKKRIPKERSLVATLNVTRKADARGILKEFVEKSEEIFKLPIMGKFLGDGFTNLVLVSCQKEHHTPKIFRNKPGSELRSVEIYNFNDKIEEYMPRLQQNFQAVCLNVTSFVLFRERSGITFQVQDVYDDDEDDGDDYMESDDEFEDDTLVPGSNGHQQTAEVNAVYTPNVHEDKRPAAKCIHEYWCFNGFQCKFKHTKQHEKFFAKVTDPNLRKVYKIKKCERVVCMEEPDICPFAHNLSEARCLICKTRGDHWMIECSLNTQRDQREMFL